MFASLGPEKPYCTIKYSTKPQNNIDNPWAIHHHAFDKASRGAVEDSSGSGTIGRRRIQSMCCTLSNPHEISAPMACLYIDRGSEMYSSHAFVKLPITSDENNDVEGGFLDEKQRNSTNEVVWALIQPTKHIDALDKSTNCAKLAASSYLNHDLPVNDISMTTDDVDAFLKTLDTGESNTTRPVNTYSLLNDYPDVRTRVQLLHRALEGSDEQTASEPIHHRLNIQQQPVTIPDLPSLYQVSLSLGLNEKQQKIFVHVGKKLLSSLLLGHHSDDQIVAFHGGLPGAGKSRVINAVQVLAEKWRSQDSVATAAYQDVAAQAANAQTIHKFFGWNVNSRKRWTPTKEQKERFAKLRLLIIDEVSTCDVSITGIADASLRLLLDNPSKLFGGIYVLLVGDWLQQLPVAG
ncbi:unnamed protein product [Phytophthora fragariaefolia]|uniref:ATP-dependent DNA helicase n=1 Tax=Phytophthora fragariaefolia TaxID=1490495 RepID=A0A9W6YF50_9STRA|nr:unnamed protein product [Phytophthora fragariaefolia]